MAISPSLQFSPPCSFPPPKFTPSATASSLSFSHLNRNTPPLSFIHRPTAPRRNSVRSTENGSETASEPEATTSNVEQVDSGAGADAELSEVGAEIKKMLKERKDKEEDGGFLSGVGEEIQKIEWPEFGKVLGITGVVLGVIAGSSVVLLTLNALLSELSDQVFAGKGVQDFFG